MCASSPLDALVAVVLAVFEPPVHDVANHGRGDQTQKLEHTKDGRVDAHCETDGSAELLLCFHATFCGFERETGGLKSLEGDAHGNKHNIQSGQTAEENG